jgi:acetyl esterase/lipase
LEESAGELKGEKVMADDALITTKPADGGETVALWPEGTPAGFESVGAEIAYQAPISGGPQMTILRNVSEPSLTVFRPAGAANGVGVIVAPGGGWRILAWEHEGLDIARWLAARGYTAFLLKYRLAPTDPDPEKFAAAMAKMSAPLAEPRPPSERPRELDGLLGDSSTGRARKISSEDGRQALKLVRARAAEWGVDPGRIGVMGFSAGAFLTVDVAMDPDGPPPAFIAPIYGGSTGRRPAPANAPPLFACIAQDDHMLVKIVEGLYRDWSDAGRPAELHVFARGGHGFGSLKRGLPVDGWMDLFAGWLADQGFA